MLNDVSGPLAFAEFAAMGATHPAAPERVVLVADHFAPAKDIDSARAIGTLRGFARAFRAIRQARPVVFHAMLSHSHAAQYAILAAVAIRTPVVVTTAHLPTQSESQMRRRLGRLVLRGVDMQVLPSEWTKAELIRLDQLHGRSQVISNGIPHGSSSKDCGSTALSSRSCWSVGQASAA